MTATTKAAPLALRLPPLTARAVMVANPISLRAEATLEETMALFADKGIDAAPVIDDGGRPLGVISRSDVFIHLVEGRRSQHLYRAEPAQGGPAPANVAAPPATTVASLMTPTVFAVEPNTPLHRLVSDMTGLHVHRLFVVDDSGVLIGVITAMDVLKQLKT